MMWRPNHELINGELDNREAGLITGWLEFERPGQPRKHIPVTLSGNFLADVCGLRLRFRAGQGAKPRADYLRRTPDHIDGVAGDISLGIRAPFTNKPIIDGQLAFFDQNGDQWLIHLMRQQARVVGGRKWLALTGDDAVDRVLVDLAGSYTHEVVSVGGKRALQLLRRNGVRETQVLPDALIDRATAIAAEWGIGLPRMSRFSRAA